MLIFNRVIHYTVVAEGKTTYSVQNILFLLKLSLSFAFGPLELIFGSRNFLLTLNTGVHCPGQRRDLLISVPDSAEDTVFRAAHKLSDLMSRTVYRDRLIFAADSVDR